MEKMDGKVVLFFSCERVWLVVDGLGLMLDLLQLEMHTKGQNEIIKHQQWIDCRQLN